MKPFTRDTFSSCIKATYCEIDGEPYPIFKNPKDGGFKKSQKGCCIVALDGMSYTDEHTWDDVCFNDEDLLKTVFFDGKLVKEYTLDEVRKNLYPEA